MLINRLVTLWGSEVYPQNSYVQHPIIGGVLSYVFFWQKIAPALPEIWANYNNSLTWIVRPFGDDSPNPNYDFQWARSRRELVMKFTQRDGRDLSGLCRSGQCELLCAHQVRRDGCVRNLILVMGVYRSWGVPYTRNMLWLVYQSWRKLLKHDFSSRDLTNESMNTWLCWTLLQCLPSKIGIYITWFDTSFYHQTWRFNNGWHISLGQQSEIHQAACYGFDPENQEKTYTQF